MPPCEDLLEQLTQLDDLAEVTLAKRQGHWDCEVWEYAGPVVATGYYGEGDGETAQEAIAIALIDLRESREKTDS